MSEDGSLGSSLSSVSDWEKEVDPLTGELFYVVEEPQCRDNNSRDDIEALTSVPNRRGPNASKEDLISTSKPSSASKRRSRVDGEQRGQWSRLAARLVRRRESKRERGDSHAKSKKPATKVATRHATSEVTHVREMSSPTNTITESDSEGNNTFYRAQLKTFEAIFEKEERTTALLDVYVRLQGRKNFPSNVTKLIEPMMGIEINRLVSNDSCEEPNRRFGQLSVAPSSPHFENVVVKGFVPRRNNKVNKVLRSGDIIRLIDGQQVSLATVDQLLSTYHSSAKVRVSLQRKSARENEVLTEEESSSSALVSSMALIYFPLESSSSPTFVFPSSSLTQPVWLQPLISIRGVISTLRQSWTDLQPSCNATASGSKDLGPTSMTLRVEQNGSVDLGGIVEDQHCLIFAIEEAEDSDVTKTELVVYDLYCLLRFLYGSLSAAFNSSNIEKNLCSLLPVSKEGIESASNVSRGPFSLRQIMSVAQSLVLPEELRFQLDDALNQLESADFQDDTEEFFDLPHEFDIHGACILYNGLLIASHLGSEDTVLVTKWLKAVRVTEKSVDVAVIWREVFEVHPEQDQQQDSHGEHGLNGTQRKRRFLMVTGQRRLLLAVILEAKASRLSSIVFPDPFYVDQAEIVLDQLDEMGVHMVCDYCLSMSNNPEQLVIDEDLCDMNLKSNTESSSKMTKLTNAKTKESGDKTMESSHDQAVGMLRRTRLVDAMPSSLSVSSGDEDGDQEDEDEYSDNSEEMRTTFRGEVSQQETEPLLKASSEEDDLREEAVLTLSKHTLSVGLSNSVVSFMHFDFAEAILITPLKSSDKPTQSQVELNFERVATDMHQNFRESRFKWERRRALTASSPSVPTVELLEEQAVLFELPLSNVKGCAVLNYWVAARLFLNLKKGGSVSEFYVCYQDTAPQNVIEMAFRMQVDGLSL